MELIPELVLEKWSRVGFMKLRPLQHMGPGYNCHTRAEARVKARARTKAKASLASQPLKIRLRGLVTPHVQYLNLYHTVQFYM